MEHEQFSIIYKALKLASANKNLNKNNVIEEIKNKLSPDSDGYKEWEKGEFSLDHVFTTANEYAESKYTLLTVAFNRADSEVANFLIKVGADVNAVGEGGLTPLIIAIEKECDNPKNKELVDLLIESADVNAADENGMTPIAKAVERGNLRVFNALMEKGANFDVNPNGMTLLKWAEDHKEHVEDKESMKKIIAILETYSKQKEQTDPEIAASTSTNNSNQEDRVKDLNGKLHKAIESLNVDQVKVELENCGTDIEKVLMRRAYLSNGDPDLLLVYFLSSQYVAKFKKEDVEKIKEITKLLWDKASHNVRDFWLLQVVKGQSAGDNYIIAALETLQEYYVKKGIADKGWLENLIKEVKDYKTDREEELSKPVLEDIEEKERIAQGDRKIAEGLQNEERNTFISSINSTDVAAAPENNGTIHLDNKKKNAVGATATTSANGGTTSPTPTADNKTPGNNDAIPLGNDTVDPTPSSVSTSTEPIADNKTPGNSDTTFWSEHKGKIALGVTGLCVAGAVAAYVLAYPAVALALAVLAAVILMGAGIAKVLESPSVEPVKGQGQEV